MRIKRLIYGSLLSLSIFTSLSLFSVVAATNGVENVKTGKECLYAEFDKITGASSYNAYIKGANISSYEPLDPELVREVNNNIRVDAVGLMAGTYSLKFVPVINSAEDTTKAIELTEITVEADDRSGYAFFNNDNGIGAYTDDGTLKNNAKVIYVTEATKNDVDEDGDGVGDGHNLAYYFANASSSEPLDVRVIGTIGSPYLVATNTTVSKLADKKYDVKVMNSSNTVLGSTIEEKTDGTITGITGGGYGEYDESYSLLEGLRSKITHGTTTYNSVKYKSYDSYFNMMDITDKENITVEGIGNDAKIDQWGFTWKRCKSIEVKNLTFENYPEDACSFESAETNVENVDNFTYSNFWVHNNTFNRGKNDWDVSYEQDKHDGDGATDFKGLKNVTVAYNHYFYNHKTGLVGGSDNHFQANITFHHNYYEQCESRLPFARQANMHMYNNYYKSTSNNNMQIYAGAYAFIENCYFEDVDKTFIISNEYYKTNDSSVDSNKTYYTYDKNNKVYSAANLETGTKIESSKIGDVEIYEKRVPAIKSYNNVFDNCNNYSGATVVTSRDATVTNNNFVSSTFDTNSDLFYLENGASNVTVMNQASELPTLIPNVAGAGKFTTATYVIPSGEEDEIDKDISYDNTSWVTYLNDDFSDSTMSITKTSSTPTNKGLYYRITKKDSDDISENEYNNVTINNSRVMVYDYSGSDVGDNQSRTTNAYYMFGSDNHFSSGKVKYSLDIEIPVNSSWKIISFINSSNDELALYSNSKEYKYLTILYKGSETNITTSAYTAGAYHVELEIDYDNGNLSLSVGNNKATINNYNSGAIKGMLFTTSAGSARTYYFDNVEISKYDPLKLGYQLGNYQNNNVTYNALRIVGKLKIGENYDALADIESIYINIKIYNASDELTKTLNKEISNVYRSLKIASGVTITPETSDNLRYYYTVINGITLSHKGYKIKATSTINLKNGIKVECSGFEYEV